MKNIIKYIRDGGWLVLVIGLLLYVLFTDYPWVLASRVTAMMMELTGWSHTVVVYVQSGVIALTCLIALFVMRRKKRSQDETGEQDIRCDSRNI